MYLFSKGPDQFCGQPSLLRNANRELFPGEEVSEAELINEGRYTFA